MFIAAGEVLEQVTGRAWEEVVREEVLRPAGMADACLSVTELAGRSNVALPHNEVAGRQTPIAWVNWDNMAPAGSLLASAEDMAKWMVLQMDSGRVRGAAERVWDAKRTREMWTLVTPQPVGDFYRKNLPSMHFRGYGMGWEVYDLHGRAIVAHSGGYDGMISRTVLVPEEKLGIFVVTNTNTSVPWGWGHDALGTLLGAADASDLLGYLLEERRKEPEEKKAAEAALQANASPMRRPRCRSRAMPAPTPTPATATSSSKKSTAASPSDSPAPPCSTATSNPTTSIRFGCFGAPNRCSPRDSSPSPSTPPVPSTGWKSWSKTRTSTLRS